MSSNEIQKLIEERRRIDEKIRELRKRSVQTDNAKLYFEHYPTIRQDEWCVSVKVHKLDGADASTKDTWRSIIRGYDKESVINEIIPIITTLTNLYQKCTEELISEKYAEET